MLRSGLAVDSAGLSLAGLPGDASPAVVLPSDSQLTFRSRFPASSETNFRRFRGTRVPGCIRGLAAGGLASEPTVSPFRARCLVQHPVESPFELPHRTKGPSDVSSSVRLQRRRLASPVLPLRRPTGPASNALAGVPDGSLTRTPATHFPGRIHRLRHLSRRNNRNRPSALLRLFRHQLASMPWHSGFRGASGAAYRWADFRTGSSPFPELAPPVSRSYRQVV